MDEQLFQLQHERADLLKRIDEDQEDLNELMEKHKALIAQVGAGAASPMLGGLSESPAGWHRAGGGPWGCTDDAMRKERLTLISPVVLSLSFKRCFALSFNTWGILQLPLWVIFILSFTILSCRG